MALTDRDSIASVVRGMSLDEKVDLLVGATFFRTRSMEDLGIDELFFLDGGTGTNLMQAAMDAYSRIRPFDGGINGLLETDRFQSFVAVLSGVMNPAGVESADEDTKATSNELSNLLFSEYLPGGTLPGCFPPGILLAATWNSAVVYACGRAVGNESRFFGIDILLGSPNVEIHRNPLNGRLFEGYSEDPHLTVALAPSFVKGVQDEGVIANVKHFAANTQETNRTTINEKISERALREIYLPGFRACVQDGGCKTVMSAYNSINGTPCAHNSWLLRDVLKGEWGFDGFVVSDWGAVYDQVEGIRGGNDVDMPGLRSGGAIVDAVKAGELDEALIDDAVTRVLRVLVDMPRSGRPRLATIDREASARAAYDAACEGFVLLKNDDKTLPFAAGTRCAVFGELSKKFYESGEGSAAVVTSESTSMFDTLVQHLGPDNVTFGEISPDQDAVVITVGVVTGEGADRTSMDLPEADRELLVTTLAAAKEAGKRTVVVLNVAGPVHLADVIDDIDALVCVFLPGMQGGRAAGDLLCGLYSPSGKLPTTFAKHYDDYGSSTNFPGFAGEVLFAEDIYVGYRHFDRWNIEPLFAFGHGLSYTNFQLSRPRVDSTTINVDGDQQVTLEVDVQNTGDVRGKEVVQVYVGHPGATRPKPPRQLKGFRKIEVEPGRTETLRLTVDRTWFEEYDEARHEWVVEPGRRVLWIGTSSRQLPLTVDIHVEGRDPYPMLELSNPLDIFSQR